MIHCYIPNHSLLGLKASVIALAFVGLEVGCMVIQAIGVVISSPGAPTDQLNRGLNLYMIGIGLQEIFNLIFLALVIKFHCTMLRLERLEHNSKTFLEYEKRTWRRLLYTIYTSLFLLTVRIIFRLAQFSHGRTEGNPALDKEFYFYVFDGIPMFLAGLSMAIIHPGMFLKGPDAVMPRAMGGCCCRRNKLQKSGIEEEV